MISVNDAPERFAWLSGEVALHVIESQFGSSVIWGQ